MTETHPYLDPSLPIAARVADLLGRMTLEEKASQMLNVAPAIERLGIPAYDWWNECLHGVGRAGMATVFPQAIGLAATFDEELLHRVGTAIADEARAKHHDALRRGLHARYFGLTFWSPNINIVRDPRWGRGHETYGEDPYLTGRLGVAFITGLQGDDPRYLKLSACAKHYAVHSGPEGARHTFDARPPARDLTDTYLPAFKTTVQEGKVESVMGAYNRVNGEACCASPTLLRHYLRDAWGFQGHVVSDCGAVEDIYERHQIFRRKEQAVAEAVKAGCDLCCGGAYDALVQSVEQGYLAEADIDRALARLFTTRFKLGMFDPPAMVPYAQIPLSVVSCPEHRALALRAARESIVLLKNDGILPLKPEGKFIGVIGPNANAPDVMMGNYNGNPRDAVTPLQGIIDRAFPGANVLYSAGCELNGPEGAIFWEAHEIAAVADVLVVVLGLSPMLEGEEGAGVADRPSLDLPAAQQSLLELLAKSGKPIVVVLLNGSALAVSWAREHAAAIVEAWYPGEAGGTAIAEVLFGDYNPGGRLPVTFYQSIAQVPDYESYDMTGRTYRYFTDEPLYPFGHGLSYTTFAYGTLALSAPSIAAGETVTVSVEVRNTGEMAGDEVVQLYLSAEQPAVPAPIRSLKGFRRIHLVPGEAQTVAFTLPAEAFMYADPAGEPILDPGTFRLTLAGGQPGYVPAAQMAEGTIEVK
ncbi:MAG TPA: glycoside hydrolase family 3 C-terminal domain-containing protein [Armatimonadota bacterium]|nr:glycoside hydrolase family 3 C-terminal domain-containing protein [Armatimonadota bacterium]